MSAEPLYPEPTPIGRRPFHKDGMGWEWDIPDYGLTMRVDYITNRSDEMHGEIRVTRGAKHIHQARFNLSSTTSRATLWKLLQGRTEGSGFPWEKLVEQFCVGVLDREREGEPTQYTQAAARRPISYLVSPLVIKGKTNMLFAPGGSGKGYLCVVTCCAVAARCGIGDMVVGAAKPFYFDWEDDFDTFEDRLNVVARGMNVDPPRIPYRRMRGLVPDRINEMARAISDAGSDFGIIDSFSAAGGTTSERTSWDTVAHRLFDALDMVPNMTWLIIDHVAGDNLKDPSGKAFGSIQKMNRVRNAWEMRSEQEAGSPTVHMKLFDAKWNHTGKRKPLGLCMEFDGDAVSFASEDPVNNGVVGGSQSVSLPTRMSVQLAAGPLDTAALAKALKCSESTIRSEMTRNRDRFRRSEDGLIRLVSQYSPDQTPEDEAPWV